MKKFNLTFLFACLFAAMSSAQPVADFTSPLTSVCVPMEVSFINLSTGDNLSYIWDFYDGVVSTETNPTHVYSNGGDYTVCLIATDDMGLSDTLCKTDYITVYDANSLLEFTVCDGEPVIVNGINYDMPGSFQQIFTSQGTGGCDSILNISISYFPEANYFLNETLCSDEIINVNSTTYTQSNPSGIEVLLNASYQGCDSIVFVDLLFNGADTILIDPILCPDQEINVNGTIYNEANPSGVDLISNPTTCDTLYLVNLTFDYGGVHNINEDLCIDDIFIVNGVTYFVDNPAGSDTLFGGAYTGCDSIINVDLTFHPNDTTTLNLTLCEGDSVVVNNTTYSAANPMGEELYVNQLGCDSIVLIDLTFISGPSIVDLIIMNASCSGLADGEIFVNVTNGAPPYIFEWTGMTAVSSLERV